MRSDKNKIVKVRISNKAKENRLPFDPARKNESAELICKFCNAVYEEKHWKPFSQMNPAHVDRLKKAICPTCHEEKAMLSDGVLHLSGTFLEAHKDEIRNIIHHMGEHAERDDILNRVERIEANKDGMTIYTAKNQLAVRLGKKIDEAYKGGELHIQFSKDDKPVEVRWHKDL